MASTGTTTSLASAAFQTTGSLDIFKGTLRTVSLQRVTNENESELAYAVIGLRLDADSGGEVISTLASGYLSKITSVSWNGSIPIDAASQLFWTVYALGAWTVKMELLTSK